MNTGDIELTYDEEEQICELIGDWYLSAKWLIKAEPGKTSSPAMNDYKFDTVKTLLKLTIRNICFYNDEAKANKDRYVCDIIDRWYDEWKYCLFDNTTDGHRLGYAKEQLKKAICKYKPET